MANRLAPSARRAPAPRHKAGGFTMIEVLVVLVILGLTAGLIVARGPPHNANLELRAAAQELAGALRLARAQAIATNRREAVTFDVAAHAYRLDDAPPHSLSPRAALSMVAAAGGSAPDVHAIIFAPDGSSSGGGVTIAEGGRRVLVGVDWLTGRVSIEGVR